MTLEDDASCKPLMASSSLRRSIGPGILLAGACIGGSHLMSSTTAGARFGFALVGLILLTNLVKYPFLRVGTRFTAATGLSLLEGFQRRNPAYLPLYLLVSLVTGTATIAAVSFVAGLLLTNVPGLTGQDPYGLSIAVLVVCGLVLLLGHYRALDRLSKLLVVLLTLLTGVAAASLLIRGPVGDVAASWVSTDPTPWTLANLAFLIPLMGWMPGPVEMCVWPSLWMFSRARDTEHTATPQEAEFDFNLGYGITVLTALFFVILGSYTMYGSGDGMLAGSGVSFAQKLIKLYTAAMGGWAAWVIIPAAFSAMFSTTLTCLDAYPRSIAAIQGLLRQSDTVAERIRRLLAEFTAIHQALSQCISAIPLTLPQPHEVTTLSSLKPVEDMLDALICAWIGIEHLEGRTVGLGYATAAIWVPQALTNHSPE